MNENKIVSDIAKNTRNTKVLDNMNNKLNKINLFENPKASQNSINYYNKERTAKENSGLNFKGNKTNILGFSEDKLALQRLENFSATKDGAIAAGIAALGSAPLIMNGHPIIGAAAGIGSGLGYLAIANSRKGVTKKDDIKDMERILRESGLNKKDAKKAAKLNYKIYKNA